MDKKEKEAMQYFMRQYKTSTKRKKRLEERRQSIESLIKGIDYTKPRCKTNKRTDQQTDYAIVKEEIEEKLHESYKDAAKTMLTIFDVLQQLEEGLTKEIMEMYYLDDKKIWEICKELPAARSTVYYHLDAGINQLLKVEKVRQQANNLYQKKSSDTFGQKK